MYICFESCDSCLEQRATKSLVVFKVESTVKSIIASIIESINTFIAESIV